MDAALGRQAKTIVLDVHNLESISSEAIRFLVITKQKVGADLSITVSGAEGQVKAVIEQSEFSDEITLVE